MNYIEKCVVFFTYEQLHIITCGHVRTFVTLSNCLSIKFGFNLYTQVVDILMGKNCASLAADFFFFIRDVLVSLHDNNQADVIEAFISTSRYLDDYINIDNPFFSKW